MCTTTVFSTLATVRTIYCVVLITFTFIISQCLSNGTVSKFSCIRRWHVIVNHADSKQTTSLVFQMPQWSDYHVANMHTLCVKTVLEFYNVYRSSLCHKFTPVPYNLMQHKQALRFRTNKLCKSWKTNASNAPLSCGSDAIRSAISRTSTEPSPPALKEHSVILLLFIIIKNEFDLGGTVSMLLHDHRTMLPWGVSRLFNNVHYTRENDCENRKVLSSRQNETIDKAAQTRGGREFEARAAATKKTRSPMVVRHVIPNNNYKKLTWVTNRKAKSNDDVVLL